ncbi:unnamed protein product [Meloidogyne enterolobii]|uniref:Uncharacterized protein n=1 Tax=Meloidogyne enterolobii TaxID=390850 RepID=A0ACB0YIE1_MELEN
MCEEPTDKHTLNLIHLYQHELEKPTSSESEITEENELNFEIKYNNSFILEAVFWRYRSFIEDFTVGGDEVLTNNDVIEHFGELLNTSGYRGEIKITDEIAERYKEFLLNGQKLLNMKELKEENLRKRLCLVHSFVIKWANDSILNESLMWSSIMNTTLGLPIIVGFYLRIYMFREFGCWGESVQFLDFSLREENSYLRLTICRNHTDTKTDS